MWVLYLSIPGVRPQFFGMTAWLNRGSSIIDLTILSRFSWDLANGFAVPCEKLGSV